MVDLAHHFVAKKLFQGPPTKMDYISYSGLREIRRVLLGEPAAKIDPKYLYFGAELHRRFLEGVKSKNSKKLFSPAEEYDLEGMQESLWKDPFVRKIMRSSIKEVETVRLYQGVNVKVILDINGDGQFADTGVDIKTTSCGTYRSFVQAAIHKYGYPGQGYLYKQAEQLKNFYFVGIQKKKPYQVYIMDVADYAKEERAAIKEVEFLLDFYKQFGRVWSEEKRSITSSSRDRKRTK
jgi:hypothetical protein